MIAKFVWISIMVILSAGAIFLASFGLDIQVAYYDRSENIVVN
jgi:hypothetical protein